MQTEPISEMNMEIIDSISHSDKSHKKYIFELRKKVKSIYKVCVNDVIKKYMMKESANKIYKRYKKNNVKNEEKLRSNRYQVKSQLTPLFKIQPQLKNICGYRNSKLVDSCFTRFDFKTSKDNDKTLNDSKFIINFCGYHLTELNMRQYSDSEIMPLIRDNCPSLKRLVLEFTVIKSEDNFENAFFNMFHLEKLFIYWQCKNSTLPLTLVNSLKQVGKTLKELYLDSKNDSFLPEPDPSALLFPPLIALNSLTVYGFRLSEVSIQSLDKLKNLTNLQLGSFTPNNHPVIDKRIDMFPTDLKNLEVLCIGWEYNVTDKFFINLCNNSTKLQNMSIIGTSITDDGMLALNNSSHLGNFDLSLKCFGAGTLETKNESITDQSVTNLSIKKLCHLNMSNCTKISNESVIKLVENLDNLSTLFIENTMVNIEIIEELSKLKKYRTTFLSVWVSFKDTNGYFDSLSQSHNIQFVSVY